MVPTEPEWADAMQTSQETREGAGKLGRNESPKEGTEKARCCRKEERSNDGESNELLAVRARSE